MLLSHRGQFYIISCITIIFSLLVADEIIHQHRPLNREAFSSLPIIFFQNSRTQAEKILYTSCIPRNDPSYPDRLCEERLNRNLYFFEYFLKNTAKELGYQWDGKISYASPGSWNGSAGYRIPIEVTSNYNADSRYVSTIVEFPISTDFDSGISLQNTTHNIEFNYTITCITPNGSRCNIYNNITTDCHIDGGTISEIIENNKCEKKNKIIAYLTWYVDKLKAFSTKRYYIYFNTSTPEYK